MSRYCTVETMFKDEVALIAALMETSRWAREQIEVHDSPQHLFGYLGKQRMEKAHIIIRRQFVEGYSNDIGFVRGKDGNYSAIISEYDSGKYGKRWIGTLTSNYAYHKVRKDMESRGRNVSRVRLTNGHQRVVVTGYR